MASVFLKAGARAPKVGEHYLIIKARAFFVEVEQALRVSMQRRASMGRRAESCIDDKQPSDIQIVVRRIVLYFSHSFIASFLP